MEGLSAGSILRPSTFGDLCARDRCGHGWFFRRYDQIRAVQFLRFIDELAALAIHPFDATALSKSAGVAKKFADQGLTLADAHGLVLMRERRIASCWSTDRHLCLTGVSLVV